MEVSNSVYPNETQLKGFMEVGPDGPIYMVNLLKFKGKADASGEWLNQASPSA